SRSPRFRTIPGLEVVGRGVYLRPNQLYELKAVLFERKSIVPYYSKETGLTYEVPDGYEVDDSPPMPTGQALNQSLVEESWDRFEKRTSLDASLAVSSAPFSVDVNASQTGQLRQEEECYYALRTSFIPLWTVYIPYAGSLSDDDFDLEIPVPFSHRHRAEYARFFERYGTHYVPRAWVGGKAALALTISKHSNMTKSEIQAGIKASMVALGSASVSTADQQSKEKLQNYSQCTVFGKGGDELRLAALSTLDNVLYNEWLATVKDNPQVIEFEAVGIWTLLRDKDRAQALMEAYKEETFFSPLRVVFNLDNQIHFFEDTQCYTYDMEKGETSKPRKIHERWPDLLRVGFERVDAAFLGKYLSSPEGDDLSRKLFMFNRDKYVRWDVDTNTIDENYPRLLAEGWPGVTFNRVDAVVNVAPESLYFFSGNRYIRFNTLTHHADEGYSDLVSRRWTGVTFDRIDAATYWGNGKVYFFRDNQYIRYDTVMWRADPGYPKSIPSHYVEDWRFFE
ncbi:MAG: hemopexin repeat-containing protein, partial [Chloroflexota bacterium]|nr:hemopexin repeat-containing protein [Chloroflexota bacterium]